jgi:hypothetical protein
MLESWEHGRQGRTNELALLLLRGQLRTCRHCLAAWKCLGRAPTSANASATCMLKTGNCFSARQSMRLALDIYTGLMQRPVQHHMLLFTLLTERTLEVPTMCPRRVLDSARTIAMPEVLSFVAIQRACVHPLRQPRILHDFYTGLPNPFAIAAFAQSYIPEPNHPIPCARCHSLRALQLRLG